METKGKRKHNNEENIIKANSEPYEIRKKRCSEGGKKSVEVKKERKRFKEVFEEILTEEKQTLIAEEFVNMVLDNKINIQNRIKIFETILSIIGENTPLDTEQFKTLSQNIVLKID